MGVDAKHVKRRRAMEIEKWMWLVLTIALLLIGMSFLWPIRGI